MAYDNPPYGRHDAGEPRGMAGQSRYQGHAGFREEPDFASPAYQPGGGYGGYGGYGEPDPTPVAATARPSSVSAAELNSVFDDSGVRAGGRDRLAVHWVWEVLLLIGVGGLIYLLWQAQPDALRGDSLSRMLVFMTGYGLLGIAAGVTLRAGAPNLAIGPVAAAAGAYFAERGNEGVATPTIFGLGVAVLLGLAVAALVVAFHVPGWAASLAGAAAVVTWLQLRDPEIPLAGGYDPSDQAAFLFAVVAALSILGGLVGTVRSVRRMLGGFRPVGDPAQRRGGMPALFTSGALVLSMVLSVLAGVVLVAGQQVPAQGSTGVNWLTWTLIGFGVALVGGTSAFGRRGGVFGTTLAVVALVVFDRYQVVQGWEIALLATAAGAMVAGLVVTRLIETFGGSPTASEPEDPERDGSTQQWETATPAAVHEEPTASAMGAMPSVAGGWSSTGADSWSSALPARPAPGTPDPWDDDRWSRR